MNAADYNYNILIAIISGTLLFLLLAFFIIVFLLIYQKRRKQHILEKQAMQTTFEQNLLQSQLEMQEQTFDSISQEIHDSVGQLLSLAKVQLSIAEQNVTTDKRLLSEIKNNIGNALNDLRDIAKSLSSERLHQLCFSQAVEQELQRMSRTNLFEVFFTKEGEDREITEQKKIIIFRILQEVLQNILKHAHANEVVVRLVFHEKEFTTDVSDNGVGFVVEDVNTQADGLGLRNIIARTSLIGGTVSIQSKPGYGTHITLNIPYE